MIIGMFAAYAVIAFAGLTVWMVKTQPEPQSACVVLKDLTL